MGVLDREMVAGRSFRLATVTGHVIRFKKDVPKVVPYEAQQAAIDLDPAALDRDANPKGALPIDQALLEMRRVIRRLHRAEQTVSAA